MIKPQEIADWATALNTETRAGGANKVEPTSELKLNGTLDGAVALNHYNYLFYIASLWQNFNNEMIVTSTGAGLLLTKDDHMSVIFAINKTNVAEYCFGFAYKSGVNPATTNTLQNNILTFDTPNAAGDVPILGAPEADIISFSLNLTHG